MPINVTQLIENEIYSKSWDLIRRRLSSNFAKRTFRHNNVNDDGHNLFHILCGLNDTPLDILEKVIATDEAYLTKKSSDQNTNALHFAAETGSAATIKFLLDRMCKVVSWNADSESEDQFWLDEDGFTPLDILWKSRLDPAYQMWNGEVNNAQSVIELIKQMDKVTSCGDMTAEMKDIWEKTNSFVEAALTSAAQGHVLSSGEQRFTIHEIVEHGGNKKISFPREVLWFAAKLYPDLLRARNETFDLPLHIALKTFSMAFWSLFDWFECSESWDEFQNDEHIRSIFNEFSGRTTVSVLLREFPESALMEDGSGRLPLQIFCEYLWAEKKTQLTSNDFDALLKAAPKAPLAIDKDGNTPLHILCKLLFHSRLDRLLVFGMILNILELAPQAAGIRNQIGRFSLNLMLHYYGPENQRSWRQGKETWGAAVALVDSAPHTLDVPDVLTRLYPFMMASVGEYSSLDCAYILLRKNPMNIRGGIIGSDYEQCHERKVNVLTTRVEHLEDELANPKPNIKRRKL